MVNALKLSWALFLGLLLIMVGNGLGNSAVGVRTQVEGFDNTLTGLVMAGYFIGFFAGSVLVPKMMASVGHVRVFGALTALASLTILVYPLAVDPWIWLAMRIATGLAYAGLYIVCESWLNEKATNETRGQLLAIYMVVTSVGMAGGQLMLNLYDPADFELFTITSILISLAAVPVLISAARAPEFEAPESMGPMKLYRISPLGTLGMVLVGAMAGILIGMGPVYGFKMFGTEFAAYFMAAVFIGGFLLTWPIGKLSDLFDRRTVITITAAACIGVALLGLGFKDNSALNALEYNERFLFADHGIFTDWNILLLIIFLFGGLSLPLYSLTLAHTNDYLTPKQMVGASSTLVMVNGAGAVIGPSLAGFAMDMLGTPGFFWSLMGVAITFVVFALYRMTRRPPVSVDDQGDFVAMDQVMTAVATTTLHPEVEWPDTEECRAKEEQEYVGPENDDAVPAPAETWDDLPSSAEDQDADTDPMAAPKPILS